MVLTFPDRVVVIVLFTCPLGGCVVIETTVNAHYSQCKLRDVHSEGERVSDGQAEERRGWPSPTAVSSELSCSDARTVYVQAGLARCLSITYGLCFFFVK